VIDVWLAHILIDVHTATSREFLGSLSKEERVTFQIWNRSSGFWQLFLFLHDSRITHSNSRMDGG